VRISPTNKQTRKCDLCGVSKNMAVFYILRPHPAVAKLLVDSDSNIRIVCKLCAMREEFGSKWKQSKRYKEWEDAQQK